ncbi:MAG: hypothetical protein V4773_04930 [Verrucomicrobiota bacterium]
MNSAQEIQGQTHPPYRRHAWIEWIDLDLGQGSSALPDLQVEFGRKTPAIGDYTAGGFGQWGVNPFAAIHALLTSETGFGIDPAYFDAAEWAAQCSALETTGVAQRTSALTYCHPVFKSAQTADALLSATLINVDGFLYADGGRFRIGWFPSQAPDVGALPDITEHDLEGAPTGTNFPDWNRGASAVTIIFRDFDRHYEDVPALCPAPSNSDIGVAATPARAERPMIHVNVAAESGSEEEPDWPPQASLIAAEIAASRESAESTVTLPVLKSRAVNDDGSPLMPGDLFVWDYAPHSLDLVMRVVGRRIRAGETSDLIEAIPERGQFPLPYVPPVDDRVLPTPAAPGEIVEADVRLWLLPNGLSGGLRKIAPLVNRAHRGIYRVDLHLSTAGSSPWSVILDSRFFAAKCVLANGGTLGSGAGTVRVTSTSVDFPRMAAQDAVAQADDTLCVLIDNEVCSVGAITVVSPGTYDLAILRGRRGTTVASHLDGGTAFLFYRAEQTSVEHVEFYRVRDGSNLYNAGIATKYFKFQLFTVDADGLAKPDDPGMDLQLPDLSPDESMGYTVSLTNVAHTVACANDGTVIAGQLGASSLAKTDVKVFRGSTALTAVASAPNSDQYSISLGTQTGCAGAKEDHDTVRGDTLTAETGTIEIVVNIAGVIPLSQVFTLTKVRAGATGTTGSAGSTGPTGATGSTVERRYMRSTLVPATPFGNNPIGWTIAIPSGSDALWVSEATKDAGGNVVGSWSSPQRLEGNVVFYLTTAPSTGSYTLVEGDLWFDTDDGNRPHRWENPGSGLQWVAKPFGNAAIANLAAGKITAGTIEAAISIGTLGYLTAGSGYGLFYVDDTELKHGAMTVAQYSGLNGTQLSIISGDHRAIAYAHNTGAGVFVENSLTGKQAILFDSGLIRGNSMESGLDGFTSNGASAFNGQSSFAAKMRLMGTNRFEFNRAGSDVVYFEEDYGGSYRGDTTHPLRVRNAALCLDGCSGGGTPYTAGRLYFSDTVYLHVVGSALWLKDSGGDRALT